MILRINTHHEKKGRSERSGDSATAEGEKGRAELICEICGKKKNGESEENKNPYFC